MKTLSQLIIETKCRRGKSHNITKLGAYWLATEPIKINSGGGDGVGQSAADYRYYLELRHYRDGHTAAVVRVNAWHQNSGTQSLFHRLPRLLECTTVEQVIAELLSGGPLEKYYDSYFESDLAKALIALGLPFSEPSPDDCVEVQVKEA